MSETEAEFRVEGLGSRHAAADPKSTVLDLGIQLLIRVNSLSPTSLYMLAAHTLYQIVSHTKTRTQETPQTRKRCHSESTCRACW